MNAKRIELKPIDNRKSFYGKAVAEERDDGTKILYSYNTPVLRITSAGAVERLWAGEKYRGCSATTTRHVNAFLDRYNVPGGGKKWFCSLAVKEA